tara:strand:- start:1256 stop:1750 length:495 start_codon:yes stop_codon:yes gene_type:complete
MNKSPISVPDSTKENVGLGGKYAFSGILDRIERQREAHETFAPNFIARDPLTWPSPEEGRAARDSLFVGIEALYKDVRASKAGREILTDKILSVREKYAKGLKDYISKEDELGGWSSKSVKDIGRMPQWREDQFEVDRISVAEAIKEMAKEGSLNKVLSSESSK